MMATVADDTDLLERAAALPEEARVRLAARIWQTLPESGRERLAWATRPARVSKTPGVIGGDACIDGTRVAVWMLVQMREWGHTEADLLDNYPTLRPADLAAAWEYAAENAEEIILHRREHEEA